MKDALENEKEEEVKKAILASIKQLDRDDATVADVVSFEKHVLPIFHAKCGICHIERTKGKLSLHSVADILQGGESGPAVVRGNLANSLLWGLVSRKTMPPQGRPKLTAVETDIIQRWITGKD